MKEIIKLFWDVILLMELLAAIVGLIYYPKLKNTYWKWFVYYLVAIFCLEAFSEWGMSNASSFRRYYFDFFVIPLEFIFMYWLYAYQSLQRKKMFWIFTSIYIGSFIPHLFYLNEVRMINSLSYTLGDLLLLILVIKEYFKQLQSDNILNFKTNKMFYINAGVMLFYIGTLPLFAFDKFLYENAKNIWQYYYTFFLIANCVMYGLFAVSFVWGKQKT
jgi:hypothetical protein